MKKKKLFSLALSVALVLSTAIMPVNVVFGTESDSGTIAQADVVQEGSIAGEEGNDFSWSLDAEGTLVINGQGRLEWDTHDFSEIEEIASKVKKLILGEGITRVWFSADFSFPELTELSLPISLEVLDTSYYGSGGFCPKLETITGGDNVTRVDARIIEGTPWVNNQGEEAIIGNAIVKYNGTAASYTTPSGVKTISPRAFAENEHLESVNLSDSITHISNEAFVDCKALTTVTGGKNLESVACDSFEGTPWEAAQEDALIIENTLVYYFGTASNYIVPERVERILPGVFDSQSGGVGDTLKSVEFTGNITEIPDDTFAECYSLTTVTLPESVTSIGAQAFAYSGLQEITVGEKISFVGEDAFRGTPWLESREGAVIFGDTLFSYEGTAIDYVVPAVKTIGDRAFVHSDVRNILIPKNVESIGEYAFGYYADFDEETHEYEYRQRGDSTIYGVTGTEAERYANANDIPFKEGEPGEGEEPWVPDDSDYAEENFAWTLDEDGTLTISDAKHYYVDLETAEMARISKKVTKMVFLEDTATSQVDFPSRFSFSNLREVYLPKTIRYVYGSFLGENLEEIIGGDGVEHVSTELFMGTPWMEKQKELEEAVVLGKDLLLYHGNAENYTIPENIKTIEDSAFDTNEFIESVHISDSVEWIGFSAFGYCSALSKVTGGNNLKRVGRYAFAGTPWAEAQGDFQILGKMLVEYTGGKNCVVPEQVERFDGGAFSNSSVESIAFKGKIKEIPAGAFFFSTVEKVILPESVNSIGMEAFEGCFALEDINIPEGVSSIGENAFHGCDNLMSLKIPKSVETVGKYAYGYWSDWSEDDEKITPYSDRKIYGEPGTEAERYAKENKIEFISTVTEKPSLTDADVTASVADQVYTGEALTPAVTVKYGTKELKKDTDYTVAYKNNINPGKATVTITGKGNYTGTKEVTFTIAQKAVKELAATLEYTETTYTGEALTPSVTVKYGTKELKKDTDYTVSYKNNINPGKATVTITGKGNYTGTKEVTFTIAQKAVKELATTLEYTETTYTGNALTPAVTVKYGTKELKKDTDYTVAYKNNTNPGKATVTITGKGNYAGTKTLTFTIAEGTVSVKSSTNTAGKPQLTWSPVKGASKYVIYRSGTSTGTYKKMHTTTGTSYTNTTAGAGYTYFYKVQALDKNGKIIAKSSIVKQKCITAVLTVKGGNSDSGKPRLTWSKMSGASKYVIYRSGTSTGTYKKMHTTTGTSYTNTSAGVGYTYFYKVQALDKNGKVIAKSSIVKQKCITAVLTVKGGNSDSGKPRLTWSKMSGASKYVIYRSGTSTGTYKKMHTTTGTSYTNTSASGGYTYYYGVQALDKNGKVIAKSSTVKQLCKLSKPKITKGNNSAGKPKLTWSKVSGASKYVIYRSGYSNGTYKKMYTTTGISYTNTSAGAGYTYFYKVVAVSKNNTNANATSQIVKQKCLSSGVKITKGNAKSGKPKLSWKKVSGAKKYEVYRSGYKNGTYKKMYTTTGTSYTNTSAKKGSTYYYKVKAIGTDTFVESNLVSVKCK